MHERELTLHDGSCACILINFVLGSKGSVMYAVREWMVLRFWSDCVHGLQRWQVSFKCCRGHRGSIVYSSEYPPFVMRKNQAVNELVSLYICVQNIMYPNRMRFVFSDGYQSTK